MADNKFFTNTYITGSGRRNYVNSDRLIEDPLFTSFTFDIDFITSPLFYTIKSDYGYSGKDGISTQIETALSEMYTKNMGGRLDYGYDILPVLSSEVLDGGKLGFGLQQNVYMDKPLYGATEYIYMVDKRNGGEDQNDVRYGGNGDGSNIGQNSYKLGSSVNAIVNESDYQWAQRQFEECQERNMEAYAIKNDPDAIAEREANEAAVESAQQVCDAKSKTSCKIRYVWDGKEMEETLTDISEAELMSRLEIAKEKDTAFENFKRKIINHGNEILSAKKKDGEAIFNNCACAKAIFAYDGSQKDYLITIANEYGRDFCTKLLFDGADSYANKFIELYNGICTVASGGGGFKSQKADDKQSFLIATSEGKGKNENDIRSSKLTEKFSKELKEFGFISGDNDELDSKYRVHTKLMDGAPDWARQLLVGSGSKLNSIVTECKSADVLLVIKDSLNIPDKYDDIDALIMELMASKFDIETSFKNFETEVTKKTKAEVEAYQSALNELQGNLYGSENGKSCEKGNATADSSYGQLLEAQNKLANDAIAQADNTIMITESALSDFETMILDYEEGLSLDEETGEEAGFVDSGQPSKTITQKVYPAPQTVLDMIGFISGMKKLTMDYPYVMQNISGLDAAYNKHYGIKDPYLGSGDDKITIICYEALDLRVSSMFNRYFNAVYDRQYRRERVPVNLRRFNCTIYVHDVRNFFFKKSDPRSRIDELTNMYSSVIEFRFYDCEIVPEETGNIFNDISNEAPSEMKKTNFTFTYGNCVVNFVPPSSIRKPTEKKEEEETEEIQERSKKEERKQQRQQRRQARKNKKQ